jgi:ribosomal subunit interface protein
MQISVSGKNMDMGDAFQEHAQTSLNTVVEKYFHNAVSGHVTLEKADSGFTVKTRVALSRRMELEATGRASNAHAALDAAIVHAEKRLRRHKRRLKNHRNTLTNGEENDVMEVPMTIYASAEQLSSSKVDKSNSEVNSGVKSGSADIQAFMSDMDDMDEMAEMNGNPDGDLPVVADLLYDIEVLTVEQAVMRIELSGENMLMFRNASHFGLNVVQRRDDGTIGWIDPRGTRHLAT